MLSRANDSCNCEQSECGRCLKVPSSPLTRRVAVLLSRQEWKEKNDKNVNLFHIFFGQWNMFISTAIAKYVICAGSALAPDLHEKYPFRSVCAPWIISIVYLPGSVPYSRSCFIFSNRLPANSVGYAPTALSSHWLLDGHWLHLKNVFNRPFVQDALSPNGQTKNLLFFYSFLVCITVVGTTIGFVFHSPLPSTRKNVNERKKAHFTFITI